MKTAVTSSISRSTAPGVVTCHGLPALPSRPRNTSAALPSISRTALPFVAPRNVATSAIPDPHLLDALSSVASHLPLAYEPVALPCSMMKCGDVLHRSTLDPVLRGETTGPDWRTFTLFGSILAYLCAPPGCLPGAVDYYILARLRNQPTYTRDDVVIGRKLATGGFGTVFKGEMRMADGQMLPVIVKKAKEFGQAEAWMNERMMRLPGNHVAQFITAFDESMTSTVSPAAKARKSKLAGQLEDSSVWLVWKYEGDNTLFDLMQSKDFPYNLEPLLFQRELRLPKGLQRKAVTIKLAFKQLLEALAAAHSTGIVHRDVKPQNCIVSVDDKKIKLIDLGAAADLRIGINYAPAEYLLDPRYAPPQQYVMSTQTPTPPPAPVAAFLSPVLWRMENPDRFDMWSCGMTLIQMVFPSLRNDNAIIAFNKKLESLKWNLQAWRAEEESRKGGVKPELVEGFALLDLDDGAGWNLLSELMALKVSDRCSAETALLSPFFLGSGVTSPAPAVVASLSAVSSAGKAINKALDSQMFVGFAKTATGEDRGSLTEAQLRQELGLDQSAPVAPRRASNTIAWWQERQNELRKNMEKREGSQGTNGGLPMKPGTNGKAAAKPGVRGRSGSPALNGNGNGNGAAASADSKPAGRAGFSLPWSRSPSAAPANTDADSSFESDSEDEQELQLVGQKAGGFNNLLGNLLKKSNGK